MDGGAGCCLLLFVLPLYLVVSGAILRGGCALYNRLVGQGSPERIAEPSLGRAMGIQFFWLLAVLALGVFASAAVLAAGRPRNLDEEARELLVALHLPPLGLVVLGAALANGLPTTFSRGLLAAMCYVLACAAVALALAALVGVLACLLRL